MHAIRTRIVSDENMRPVAVQIDYADWLEIQSLLKQSNGPKPATDLARHRGRVNWPVDGLKYQDEARSEWD